MKASISCRFTAIVDDIKVRQTTAHAKEFISLKVFLLADDAREEPVWVSTFHDVADLKEALAIGQRIKIEGKIKLHRYTDSSGNPQSLLKIDADEIALVLTGLEKAQAKAAKEKRKAEKETAKEAQPALQLSDEVYASSTQLYQGSADLGSGKKYARPFDDPISDLFPQ